MNILKASAQVVREYMGNEHMPSEFLAKRFSIGICASNDAPNLPGLLESISNENIPKDLFLSRIILVASACSKKTMNLLKASRLNERLSIVEENVRHGKADAINKIFNQSEGEFLVFINADALPKRGSITRLLSSIDADESVGIASAMPFLESSKGIASKIEEFMWSVHNESSLLLNHMGISNHTSDEMMVVRSSLLRRLPEGLVNDGAFMAAIAKKEKYSIRFCEDAEVKIEAPARIVDSIRQRQRIIFGHLQVWRLIGKSPLTVESMFLFAPSLSLKILVRVLAKSPRVLALLPVAVVGELMALIMALTDFTKSSDKHRIWRRYEN